MTDPVGDWYAHKAALAKAWAEERDALAAQLATPGLNPVSREVLTRKLRLAQHELDAAQYVGD